MTQKSPIQSISVFRADDFRAISGVQEGDAISTMDDLVLDDTYALSPDARQLRLTLEVLGDGGFLVTPDSELGMPGATLHIDCAIGLMTPDGQAIEALILVEVDDTDHVSEIFLLPLSRMHPRAEYSLVSIDGDGARQKLAQVACVSFSRGTHITLATGRQLPIEDLRIGDRVLTRDNGAQEVRWIGHSTVRATGDFAPIVIKAGVLNNENDLVVSPDHRLFVYQRHDALGAGRAELLVKARHLVNGDTVFVRESGYVDYFQILFDRHHIIYAEGIAAESMLIDPRTRPALPPELLERISPLLDKHGTRGEHGLDVARALLDRPDAIDLLRRASAH